MGHWVTLDDDQHVYISSGGKVLATRSQISSAGGGKERGRALAAKSKAAIGRATSKPVSGTSHVHPAALQGKMPIGKMAAGVNPSEIAKSYGLPHDFYTDARVQEKGAGGFPTLRGEVHVATKYDPTGEVEKAVSRRQDAQKNGLYEGTRRKFYDQKVEEAIGSAAKRAAQSPATTRAIEHAKAEGRGTPERAALAKQRLGERAGMARVRAMSGNVRPGDYVKGSEYSDKKLVGQQSHWRTMEGKVVSTEKGVIIERGDKTRAILDSSKGAMSATKPGERRFTPERSAQAKELVTQRAIEHAKAAGPTLREQADKAYQDKTAKIQRVGLKVETALKQARSAREAKGSSRVSPREKVLSSRLSRVVRQIGK